MPAAQGIQKEAAGGSIHNQVQLHSFIASQKALILADFTNAGACSGTVCLVGLRSRGSGAVPT